jgi:hypothetical protein
MAGGSDEHNAIAGRLAMLLGMRLPQGYRYYSPDQRFGLLHEAELDTAMARSSVGSRTILRTTARRRRIPRW